MEMRCAKWNGGGSGPVKSGDGAAAGADGAEAGTGVGEANVVAEAHTWESSENRHTLAHVLGKYITTLGLPSSSINKWS